MIVGIGSDICSISRLEQALKRTPRLGERLFHANELSLSNQSLAARFAAKEAISKAIGNPRLFILNEIEIARSPSGKPEFRFHHKTKERVQELGILNFHLSLTHDAGMALATVVVEGK
jgi:holo-[acyl-carrier protein] synthase